jgi:hypothetical protein
LSAGQARVPVLLEKLKFRRRWASLRYPTARA